ncbi:Predicted dehydrogenase [Pseudonocardia thermophila]|uniref:Predicted dehydrogenase n=1 Tax=Pseudonocardia thermophila TaxID=1848 RepID=A0A1M6YWA5_PSETH|nr:Predicted dehydrogenase [Pseudonocardia thermophila]
MTAASSESTSETTGSTPPRLGVAVIGAGYWGPNLIRNAQATPEMRVEYLCDLDGERARRVLGEYSTVKVATSVDEVLADPAVDAVAIATPAATHFAVAMAALEAGKHVLVEKPIAPTFEEGLTLAETADRLGLVLMVDHTFCYTNAVAKLREMIRGGELGELQYIDSVRINLGLIQSDVDVLWDLAPHDLSIFENILPEDLRPVEVAAQGSDPVGAGHACVAYLTLKLSNGVLAHVHVNWLSPTKIRNMIVGGSERMVVWDDLSVTQKLSVYDSGAEISAASLDSDDRAATIVAYRKGDMVAPAMPNNEALRGVMAEFVASINEKRAPLTDGWSGLQVLAALEAASQSLASGGAFVPIRQVERPHGGK